MAIKAGPLVPQRVELLESDPSGDTWVYITPATNRSNLERGEMLRDIEVTTQGVRVNVNPYLLQNWQIWASAGAEDIGRVIVIRGDDEEDIFEGKGRDDLTRAQFMELLQKIPPTVIAEWNTKVLEVNADWRYPL